MEISSDRRLDSVGDAASVAADAGCVGNVSSGPPTNARKFERELGDELASIS